jgi:hypothetical protein
MAPFVGFMACPGSSVLFATVGALVLLLGSRLAPSLATCHLGGWARGGGPPPPWPLRP